MHDDDLSTTITWEILNAYVDNELDAGAAARVAAAVAKDPSLASRVAALTRLRAVTRSCAATAEPPPFKLPRRPIGLARFAALAASLVFCLALGGAWWLLTGSGEASRLGEAVAAHQAWLAEGSPVPARGRVQVSISGGTDGTLPDLSAAGLQLVHVAGTPKSAVGGILAGYRGPNGCRLGLWIGPRERLTGGQPIVRDQAGLSIRAWNDDDAAYALISRNMDPARLDRFATIVARLVAQDHGVTEEQRLALAEASQVGSPCAT